MYGGYVIMSVALKDEWSLKFLETAVVLYVSECNETDEFWGSVFEAEARQLSDALKRVKPYLWVRAYWV